MQTKKVKDRGSSFFTIGTVNLLCTLTLSPPALLSIANFSQSGVMVHTNMVQHNATKESGLCLCLVPDVEIDSRGLAEQDVTD